MNLVIEVNKNIYSNCLIEALKIKRKTHGKIYYLDRFYQKTLYTALRHDKQPVHALTKHYFVVTPDFDDGEEGYIYQFRSVKHRVKCALLFKGFNVAMYKKDGFNTFLYNLIWAMDKLGYSKEDIKNKVLSYERTWNCKSVLGDLFYRGIDPELEQTYRAVYPNLIKDLETIGLPIQKAF